MKKLLITLCVLVVNACSNSDDKPIDQVDTLPPITQTGENTFACLINGKPFFSSSGRRATYTFADGAYTLSISGWRNDDIGLRSILLAGIDIKEGIKKGIYPLNSENSGSFDATYLIDGGVTLNSSTTDETPGILTITRFDLDEFIVSGTFEFTVVDDEGNKYEITDGRFDLEF